MLIEAGLFTQDVLLSAFDETTSSTTLDAAAMVAALEKDTPAAAEDDAEEEDSDSINMRKENRYDLRSYLEDTCKGYSFSSEKSQGRNLFMTGRGCGGVGPPGDNTLGNNCPAVQVGDHIPILSTADSPGILRPIDEEYFSLVGLAHVPYLTNDTVFKKCIVEEAMKFRIR